MARKRKTELKDHRSPLEISASALAGLLENEEEGFKPEMLLGLEATEEEFQKQLQKAREIRRREDPRAVLELAAAWQLAFMLLAEKEGNLDFLGDLVALAKEPALEKEIRRLVHRMRSRGVELEVSRRPQASVMEKPLVIEEKPLPCYLSPLDGEGLRFVLMSRYVPEGVEVYQFVYSDSDGLHDFNGGVIGRNRYRALLKDMAGEREDLLLAISYEEARKRLLLAAEAARQAGRALPEEYLRVSSQLPPVGDFALQDAAEEFPPESLPPELAEQAGRLLDLPIFSNWTVTEKTLKFIDQALAEVENMQTVIDDRQRLEQINRAFERAVENLLEGEERRRWSRRLLEMALFLKRLGEAEAARLAAAAGRQLEQEGFEPAKSGFFSRLIRRMLKSPEELLENMKKKAQLTSTAGQR
jgi:hypothetical protein